MNHYIYHTPNPTYIEGLITLIGVLPLSIVFASILFAHISNYCFGTYDNANAIIDDEIDDEIEDEDEIQKYTTKYPLDNAICSDEHSPNVNEHSYVLEYTPHGIVIMKYNYDSDGFQYWANYKQIPYTMLETVARKYITLYCCKELYIDRKQLQQENKTLFEEKQRQIKEQENMIHEDTLQTEDDTSSENSVFASFKSYNKPNQQQQSNTQKSNTQTFINVCERSNSFSHRGTIQEFECIQTTKYNVVETRPKLDFETFKKMFAQQKENIVSDGSVEHQIDQMVCNDTTDDTMNTLCNNIVEEQKKDK